jgi:DNA-binding Xre family transcriptional regulator
MAQSEPIGDLEPRRVVGTNVYRRRVYRTPKMSQEALATRSGVSVNLIRKLERSRDPTMPPPPYPRLDKLEALAAALDCAVTDLLATPSSRSGKGNGRHLVAIAGGHVDRSPRVHQPSLMRPVN